MPDLSHSPMEADAPNRMDGAIAGAVLYYAPTSPFSRKVRIAIRELGLIGQISEVMIDPWSDPALRARNPLAKVPTLMLADGMAVFESTVICDFLDEMARNGGMSAGIIPQHGMPRLVALSRQGLADGMMAACGRLFADMRRPENERSDFVMNRQHDAVQSGIAAITAQLAQLRDTPPDLGVLSIAAALQYADFRWPDGRFAISEPLRDWMDGIAQRPSLLATTYHLLPG